MFFQSFFYRIKKLENLLAEMEKTATAIL